MTESRTARSRKAVVGSSRAHRCLAGCAEAPRYNAERGHRSADAPILDGVCSEYSPLEGEIEPSRATAP